MTTAAPLLRIVVESAEKHGVGGASLLQPLGLSLAMVSDAEARFPTRTYLELFSAAEKQVSDPAFSVTVATALNAAAFGLVGFVLQSASTLREAIDRLGRYSRLLCNELRVDAEERKGSVAVVYDLRETPYVAALFEMAFVHFVRTAKKGTRGAFSPTAVRFRHAGSASVLGEALGVEVELDASENAIVVASDGFDLPLRGANPPLLRILEAHSANVLAAIAPPSEREDDVRRRTREAIAELLPRGEPALDAVASRLAMGDRTLQRRLREAGSSFRRELDDVRKELAIAHLARPNVSACEVAYSLGFADPSAFHHAFRRWTGKNPGGRAR